MRSGFKQSLQIMASMAVASMMDWSKAYTAKAEPLPPALASMMPHKWGRKSRIASAAGKGRQGQRNAALAVAYRKNPMNYLPGRNTAVLMRIKGQKAMMKAAGETLAAYRENGFYLDKIELRSAPWKL
jgi:hypothetical protein